MFKVFLKDYVEFLYEGGVEYLLKKEPLIYNPFYNDILKALIRLKKKMVSKQLVNPSCDSFLWFSDTILIDGKSFFIRDWYKNGIFYVNDLVGEDNLLLSFDTFKEKFHIRTDFMTYNSVCNAVKKYFSGRSYSKNYGPFRPRLFNILLKHFKGSTDFYAILNYENVSMTSNQKWEVELNYNFDNWQTIYKLPFCLQLESKYKWFQYRIVTRILGTNRLLHKMHIAASDLCTFCRKEPETIIHLFCKCENVIPLWQSLRDLILSNYAKVLILNDLTILFGLFNDQSEKAINKLIIWLKFFIYRNKYNFTGLKFSLFMREVSFYLNVEFYIAKTHDKLNDFFNEWEGWIDTFQLSHLHTL